VLSGEYIKTYIEQANRQNFHLWKAIVGMLHGYSRIRSPDNAVRAAFSAIAGLLLLLLATSPYKNSLVNS